MNKLWTLVIAGSSAFESVACDNLTEITQFWYSPHQALENISLVLFLITVLIISAWATNLLLNECVQCSRPKPLASIKSYVAMAKDVGLLSDSFARNLLKAPRYTRGHDWREIGTNFRDEDFGEQQLRDELQCEMELLLNELHRFLIGSWFDSVSPKDPDFPRATRQALARAAIALQAKISLINPCDAAQIFLMLINSHLHKTNKQHSGESFPAEEIESADEFLDLISEALVSTFLSSDINSHPGGQLLSSLLSHGALLYALSVISNPGWLALQVAHAITGETVHYSNSGELSSDEMQVESPAPVEDVPIEDDAESFVQEACTPAEDPPDFLMWTSDLGTSPQLWGTCSQLPEQPSLPQIIEPFRSTTPLQTMKKASEAEWLNPSPPRQQLGMQLSKSSQDLRQVSSLQFSRDECPIEDLKIIKKELTLGSFVRGETSNLSLKMREAGSDVLGSLRAKATSHLSALLSPARESSPPPLTLALQRELLPAGLGEEEGEDDSVSPVYEEASDLATSIAKLRALLQNHESKSSTEDDDVVSHVVEEHPNVEAFQHEENQSSSSRPVWDLHPDADAETEWMEAEEAPELPDDGRPFMNISIPATELSCDASGQQFVQYCIQYDAVYVQEGDDGPRLVLQTTSVKRRFQEFVNLQNSLEENSVFRSALRAVKSPSRWLSLAFSKAGQQTTAARLPVLERFLQQLCEQPVLARSHALRNFLAYGSQRAIAFNKQGGSDIPRLDKILARTVSGVFHSIKTALPSFDFELSSASNFQQLHHGVPRAIEEGRTTTLPGLLGFVGGRPQPRVYQPPVFMEKPPQQRDLARDIQKFLSTRVEAASEALIEDPMLLGRKISGTSEAHTHLATDLVWKQQPLTCLFEEIFMILLPNCWLSKGALPFAIRTWLQEWTEEKLQVLACQIWSLPSALCCLRLCRAALAPGNSVRKVTWEEGETALKEALGKCLPGWMQLIIGTSSTQKMHQLLTDALHDELANQQLLLNLIVAATHLLLSTSSRSSPLISLSSAMI